MIMTLVFILCVSIYCFYNNAQFCILHTVAPEGTFQQLYCRKLVIYVQSDYILVLGHLEGLQNTYRGVCTGPYRLSSIFSSCVR